MKRHILKHNHYHHDAYANQCLEPLKHGFSPHMSNDDPGSEFTRMYPQLHVDPDQRLFPQDGYRIDKRER